MLEATPRESPHSSVDRSRLCQRCRAALDRHTRLLAGSAGWRGSDAPATLPLFCGDRGRRCTNPPSGWLTARLEEERLEREDVFECPRCGGFSAFAPAVAELLGIPTVGACSCWEITCGHCRTMFVERDAPIVSPLFGHAGKSWDD
jgi:hypothetical protein